MVALGQSAEQLGFDSIWTMDHLLNIGFVRDRQIHRSAQHRHGSTAARKKWSTPSAITAAWVSSTWSWRRPGDVTGVRDKMDQIARDVIPAFR